MALSPSQSEKEYTFTKIQNFIRLQFLVFFLLQMVDVPLFFQIFYATSKPAFLISEYFVGFKTQVKKCL